MWSDIGAAAHIGVKEGVGGLRSFTPAQGIAALESIMSSTEVQVGVSEFTDWKIVKEFFHQGNYFEELKSDTADDKFEKYDHLIEAINKATTVEERQEKIEIYIATVFKQTLNMPQGDTLDLDQNISELGVDSLMAMELKNRLQSIVGDKNLSVSAFQDNRTIRSLSAHMAHIFGDGDVVVKPVAELVKEDVVLPEDIKAAEIPPLKPSQFKNILLTGVTGHLGIYCLAEFMNSARGLTVYCLIRGKSDTEAQERLNKVLKKYSLSISNMENVKVIAGDVSKDNFGLTPETYETLVKEVDAIMHSACKINHLDNYSDGSAHDMRTHNVFGLLNILKLASTYRTKAILFPSTLPAVTSLNEAGQLSEEFPREDDMGEGLTWGYMLSKFVGEKLMGQARERGIPVMVVRYPFIFGSTKTGYMPPGYNHAWSSMLASFRIRMLPKGVFSGIPIMAVDSAAVVTAKLLFTDGLEDGVYNLTVDSSISEENINDLLEEYGASCEMVPFSEWRDAIFEEQDGNVMAPFASLYGDKDGESRIFTLHSLSKESKNINVSYFSDKMKRNYPEISNIVLPAMDLLRLHMQVQFQGGSESK